MSGLQINVSQQTVDVCEAQLRYETRGDFWGVLEAAKVSLIASREYEDFIVVLGGNGGSAWQNALAIPHPSGVFWDTRRKELIVASTRSLNQVVFFSLLTVEQRKSEILPFGSALPPGDFFVPRSSVILPGSLYIHDVARIGDSLYATMTGHNFLGRIRPEGGWERVWWPKSLDVCEDGFRLNHFQLNSIARADTIDGCFFTGFSDCRDGAKPWKAGFGPKGKGVVFSASAREVILRGLTCPHSARLVNGDLWVCNSGFGEVGIVRHSGNSAKTNWDIVQRLDGFTRGFAPVGEDLVAVGLSKVIPKYEPYAPGLSPEKTRCAVVLLDRRSGAEVASLTWPDGYQIYDIQVVPGVYQPLLSHSIDGNPGNTSLRHLG